MGFGQETGNSLGFGTEQGETVFGIRHDDVEVRERGQEKQAPQVSNVMGPTPGRFQGLELPSWIGQGGFIGLQAPPGWNDQQREEESSPGPAEPTQDPGDESQQSAYGEDPDRVQGIAADPLSQTGDNGRQDRPLSRRCRKRGCR